jgi:hypothetical protein
MTAQTGPPVASERTRVLLLAGSGRSGSTVLANILGSVDGVFCGGEIRYLWERGLRDDRLCGCGQPFGQCSVWHAILTDAAAGASAPDVERLVALAGRAGRVRNVPRLLLGGRSGARALEQMGRYPGEVARLYPAIAAVTGCSLVVDSSKLPAYGWLLDRLPTVDLSVVHLVRDPRAAAYSWQRKKPLTDGAASSHMQRHSPAKSAALWNVWNLTASVLWRGSDRYLRLTYEDFVRRPRFWTEQILELAGHDADLGPVFANERTVRVRPSHTVAGNPDRLRNGDVTLRLDDEWATGMRRRDRAVVTALTAPLRGLAVSADRV